MTTADIARLKVEYGACFADDREKLAEQRVCLPVVLGVDSKVGKQDEVVYACSDVCPRYGGTFLRYVGLEEKACCALGGFALHDSAFGGYLGCEPPAVFAPGCSRWLDQLDEAAEEQRLVRELLQ